MGLWLDKQKKSGTITAEKLAEAEEKKQLIAEIKAKQMGEIPPTRVDPYLAAELRKRGQEAKLAELQKPILEVPKPAPLFDIKARMAPPEMVAPVVASKKYIKEKIWPVAKELPATVLEMTGLTTGELGKKLLEDLASGLPPSAIQSKEWAKGLLKAGVSLYHLPSALMTGKAPDKPMVIERKLDRWETVQSYFKDVEDQVQAGAPWWLAVMGTGSEAIMDMAIVAGLAQGALTGIAAKIPKPKDLSRARQILNVSEKDPMDVIKEKYRAKAHIYHPDKPTGSESKMAEINQAYADLTGIMPKTTRLQRLAQVLTDPLRFGAKIVKPKPEKPAPKLLPKYYPLPHEPGYKPGPRVQAGLIPFESSQADFAPLTAAELNTLRQKELKRVEAEIAKRRAEQLPAALLAPPAPPIITPPPIAEAKPAAPLPAAPPAAPPTGGKEAAPRTALGYEKPASIENAVEEYSLPEGQKAETRLPAYEEWKKYLTAKNPFLNLKGDDLQEKWSELTDKLYNEIKILKNKVAELTEQAKADTAKKKELLAEVKDIKEKQIPAIEKKRTLLEEQNLAVQLKENQDIVDEIFTLQPNFDLVKSIEHGWEQSDYEGYLVDLRERVQEKVEKPAVSKPEVKKVRVSKRYDRAIENIKREVAEDPDRHPAAIIASQGFIFIDEIRDLVDYAVDKNDQEFIKIIKDAGWDEYLPERIRGEAAPKAEKILAEREVPVEKKPAEVAPKEEAKPEKPVGVVSSENKLLKESKVRRKIELESVPPNLRSEEEIKELEHLRKFLPEEKPAEEEYIEEELFITPKAEKLWATPATSPVKIRQPRAPKAPRVAKVKPVKDIEQNILKIMATLVDKKIGLPILRGVAIKGDEAIVTDLETAVIYKLDEDFGRNISIGQEMSKASSLEEAKTLQNVSLLDLKEYPVIPEVKDGPKGEITLSANQLNKALVIVGKTGRPEIDGVFFKSSPDGLKIVSTDSFRLWEQKTGIKTPEGLSFTLPELPAKKLLKVIKAVNPGTITVQLGAEKGATPGMVQFSFGKFKIITRVVEDQYPSYEDILPKKYALSATVSRDALLRLVQKAKPFIKAGGQMDAITFEIKKDAMNVKVMGKNEQGGAVALMDESIPAVSKKDPAVPAGDRHIIMPIRDGAPENGIILNRNYVEDFLKNVDGNEVTLMLEKSELPAELVDEGGAEIASFMRGDLRYKSLDIVRRIGSKMLGFALSRSEAKYIKRLEEVLKESGLLQTIRKNLIGEKFETLDQDILGIFDKKIMKIAHSMFINPGNRIDATYHELTHILWLSLTKQEKAEVRKIFYGLKKTDPQFIKNVFSAEVEAWYRARYSAKIKELYPNLTEETAKELLEKKIDSEFLAHVAGKKMRFDTIIRKKLTGWLNKVLDAFLNLIRKIFRIHPAKFEIPSNKLNNLIEKIFSSGGKRGPPAYWEEDIPMAMVKMDPEEFEVRELVSKGERIPKRLAAAVKSLREKGMLETKGDIMEKERKLISADLYQKIQDLAAEKRIKPGQVKRLAKEFLGTSNIKELSEGEALELKNIINNITPKIVAGRVIFSIPRTTAITTADYLKNIKDITFLEEWLEPRTVFKRAGIEKEIGKPLLDAQEKIDMNTNKKIGEVKQIMKLANQGLGILAYKEKARRSELIWHWLNAEEIRKWEIAKQMAPNVLAAAKQIMPLWGDYLIRINADRARRGKKPLERFKDNYVPHLIEDAFKEYVFHKYPFPLELRAIMEYQVPTKKFVRFLLERKGGLPVKKDVWAALGAYIPVVERMLVLNPVMPRVRLAIIELKKTHFDTAKYVEWYVKSELFNQPHEFEKKVDKFLKLITDWFGTRKVPLDQKAKEFFGKDYIEVPRWILKPKLISRWVGHAKSFAYLQTIALSFTTGLLNLTQPYTLAWPKLKGPLHQTLVDMLYGTKEALKRVWRPSEWQKMREEGLLTDFEEQLTRTANIRGVVGAIKNFAFWNMKVSEFINRVSTTFAKQRNVLRTGEVTKEEANRLALEQVKKMHGEEAMRLGKTLSDLINFKYGKGYRPKIFSHPVANLFYIFNTFALKQLDLIVFDVLAKQKTREILKDFWDIGENKSDRKYKDYGQMWEDFSAGERGEFLRMLGAFTVVASAASLIGYTIWDEIFTGFKPTMFDWWNQFTKFFTLLKEGKFTGLNAQVQRIADLMGALETGGIIRDEKLREKVDPWKAIKRTIFGVGRTGQGKKLQKAQKELSKLEPGSYFRKGGWEKSDYEKIKNKIIDYIVNKQYSKMSQIKADAALVKKIKDYNLEAKKRLDKIIDTIKPEITKKDYESKLKEITISPADITRWIKTRKRQRTIPAFERRF